MSEYEDMLEEWECHSNKLVDLMPKMHEALLKEGGKSKEAGDKMKRDLLALGWSEHCLVRLLYDEAKHVTKPKKIDKSQSQNNTKFSNPDSTILLNKQRGKK